MLRLPPSLTTPRLLLRHPVADDAGPFFRSFAADPVATRFLTWSPYQRAEDLAIFLDSLELRRVRGEEVPYAVAWREEPAEPFGVMTVRDLGCRAELGFVLGRATWGRGVMVEALGAVVPAIFATSPEVWRVQAFADAENAASVRVLEKAGLRREGLLRRYAIHACSPDPRDVWLYAITRDDVGPGGPDDALDRNGSDDLTPAPR